MTEEYLPNPANLLSQKTRTAKLNQAMHLIETPAFVFDETLLEDNLKYLQAIASKLDIKIIFAQKSYSFFSTYSLISKYLSGSTASGLYEAILAKEEFPGEIHVFSPAYKEEEIHKLIRFSDYIYFNSFSQWSKYKHLIDQAKNKGRTIEVGLRINPEFSQTEINMYNPAKRFSRLGITLQNFKAGVEKYGLEGIDGLHFHVLCEENADALENVVSVFKNKFGDYLADRKWINFGGGHHLTRKDYNVKILQKVIDNFRTEFRKPKIYLEPGEAISLDTGFMVSEVLSTIENEINIGILDTSASCHMPDILEVPYIPRAFLLDDKFSTNNHYVEAEIIYQEDLHKFSGIDNVFRLAGPTCLAGDIIGNYRFPRKLKEGDRIVFCDMALYAHVKTNTFNGMPLPDLILLKKDGTYQVKRNFDYSDFKNRLGPLDV